MMSRMAMHGFHTRLLWLALAAWPALAASLPAAEPTEVQLPRRGDYFAGRHVYQRHCIACHGRFGDGRGELVIDWAVRPRNFRTGIFKYGSTPPEALPTDDDLRHIILTGVPGTAMPSFKGLMRDHDIELVLAYIKFLSPRWQDPANYAPPLHWPTPPDWLQQPESRQTHLEQGRALFAATCAACHGPVGRGDGPASQTLEDAWGHPIRPADLTRENLRLGDDPETLYRLITRGIPGTPMPAFSEALTEEQRWEIVAVLQEWRRTRD